MSGDICCDFAVEYPCLSHTCAFIRLIIPEPTARSAVPGVSPGRGLLIPHGYLHPGKSEHSEGLRTLSSTNISGGRALASRQSKMCRQKHGGYWPNLRHYDVVSPLFHGTYH